MTIAPDKNLRFTADHHFDHVNIIRFGQRPFGDVQEMNEALIENRNRAVRPGDTVYHFGDIFLMPSGDAKRLCHRLNGSICL